jgi:hypothetical protein
MSSRIKRMFRRESSPQQSEAVKFYSNPGTFELETKTELRPMRPMDFRDKKVEVKKPEDPWKEFAQSYREIMGKKEEKR